MKTDTISDKTVNGSTLDIKGKYASSTEGDMNITGSSLNLGEEAEITTGGSLNITAAYNEHFEEHKSEKSGALTFDFDLYAMQLDMEGKGSTTATGSVINAGSLKVKSGSDIYVEGSELNSTDADISAAGSFTQTSAKETNYEYSIHEKMSLTGDVLKDLAKGLIIDTALASVTGGTSLLFTSAQMFDFEDGRLKVDLASGEYKKTENTKDITTQKSSVITTSDGLAIDSGKDIIIAGSDINAGGDVNLTAVNNVSIETTKETTEEHSKEISGEAKLTAGVKNSATDVYNAGVAVKTAYETLEKAKKDYDAYKDSLAKAKDDLDKGLIDQDEYDSIKSDEKYYIANIALCTEDLAAKTAGLLKATAGAAGSAKTFGFNADLKIDIDALIKESESLITSSKGSNISAGGNFTVKAGNTAKIEGSNVNADSDIIIDAESVDILAAENSTETSSDEKKAHITATLYDTSGGMGVNASASDTKSVSDSTTYTNSHLNASNITITSTKDTTVKGAVVKAENDLTLDVDGDLTVESLQDKNSSKSVTLGVSGGYSGGGANAGANFNLSKTESKWVNEQTSLTGGGKVDIDVEDKTTLKGAVIASTHSTGSGQAGDLTLETGSLEYSNIKDKDKSYSVGGGMDVGTKSDKSYGNYEFSDKKQTNFATIGEGNIIITDSDASAGSATTLDKLNRDLTVAQYNTKEGGLKGGFTIDNTTVDFLTDIGGTIKYTAEEIEKGANAGLATTKEIVKEADDLKDQVSKLLFGESIGGVVDGGIKNSDFTYYPPEAGSKEVNEKKQYLGKLINDLMIDKGYSQFDEEGNVISFNERWKEVSDQDKLLISLLVADELSNNNQYSKKDFDSLDMKVVANKVFDMADNGLINLGTSENNYNTTPGLIESIKNCITGETFKPTLDISESAMENPLTMAYSLIHEGTHAVDYESDWAQFFMENNKTTINSISEINARINETVAFSQTLGNFTDIANGSNEITIALGSESMKKMAGFYNQEYEAYKENSVNGIIQNLKDHIKDDISGFQQYSNLNFDEYEDYRFVLNGGKTDEWTKIEGPYMLKNNLNSEPLTWPNKSLTNPNFGKDNYNYYKKSYNNQIEQKKYEDENPQFTKPGLGVDKKIIIIE